MSARASPGIGVRAAAKWRQLSTLVHDCCWASFGCVEPIARKSWALVYCRIIVRQWRWATMRVHMTMRVHRCAHIYPDHVPTTMLLGESGGGV